MKAVEQKEKYAQFVNKMKEKKDDKNNNNDKEEEDSKFDIENEKNKLKMNGYDDVEAQKISSILTYEKCMLFHSKIVEMKKWIKNSKQNMRNLKTEFAENHKYLELKLNKFSEMKDEFYYQRGVLYQ